MARYTGPVCKLCRRAGEKLFLKGDRCLSPKCPFERERSYPPGDHGRVAQFRSRQRPSDYSRQLREKQKARRVYGILERQFRRYFREAERRPGQTGDNLLVVLESRLDNVIYRLGIGASRAQARQLVQHGHFLVNDRRTRIPSMIVSPGDTITVRQGSRRLPYFRDIVQNLDESRAPSWLSFDAETLTARVLTMPARDQIETSLSEQLIVEYYSR
ncbi:MAG: 30S ribosomal protein S4 [Anaerolineales bacterium]|nr:30S ribosomal protein S4 [Anaerolineales bacterium]